MEITKEKEEAAVLIKSTLNKGALHPCLWKFAARKVDHQLKKGKLELYITTLPKIKGNFGEAGDLNQSSTVILLSHKMQSLQSLADFYFLLKFYIN